MHCLLVPCNPLKEFQTIWWISVSYGELIINLNSLKLHETHSESYQEMQDTCSVPYYSMSWSSTEINWNNLHETHLENYQEMQKDTVSILLNFLRKHVLYLWKRSPHWRAITPIHMKCSLSFYSLFLKRAKSNFSLVYLGLTSIWYVLPVVVISIFLFDGVWKKFSIIIINMITNFSCL